MAARAPCAREGVVATLAMAAVAALEIRRWTLAARQSLWLDETATQYLIAGEWGDLVRRLALHPQMSPGYYVVVKALELSGLPPEAALRWPSLAAVLACGALLYLLARRLLDATAAAAAVVVVAFLLLPPVAYHASNARPYALGLACVAAAALFLVRLCDSRRVVDLVGLVVFGAATVWVHYTLGIVLIALAAYAWERARAHDAPGRLLLAAGAGIAALSAPLMVRMAHAMRSADGLSFAPTPRVRDLAAVLAVPLAVAAGVKLLSTVRQRSTPPSSRREAALHLIHAWVFLPPIATYVLATATPAKLFLGRYYVSMWLALALLVGSLVQRLDRALARWAVAVALVPLAVRPMTHPTEDWRGAVQAVQRRAPAPDTPILLASGYVEARDAGLATDPAYRDYLTSPLLSYPLAGKKVVLPDLVPDGEGGPSMGDSRRVLDGATRFVLLSREGAPVIDWVRRRASASGFACTSLGEFERVTALWFERPPGR